MSPGYVGFVALFARLSRDTLTSIVAAQILVDAFTCVLTALLAAGLFGRPAGFLAGLLLAVHGSMVLASTRVLPETLAAFVLVLLALALSRLHERPSRATSAAAGLLLGLLCLLRSNAILFLPLLLIGLAMRRGDGRRAGVARAAAALAGCLAAILPVTLWNAVIGRDLVLISTNGGVNFLIGNATAGDGRFVSLNSLPLAPGRFQDDPSGGAFERSVQAYAESRTGRILRPSQVSTFWWRMGLSEISRDPVAWTKLLVRKCFLLVNGFEIPQVENIYFTARSASILRGPLSHSSRVLWPFGLAGLLLLLPERRIPPALLLLFASYACSILIFFVTARLRLPLTPLVACFAAFAVTHTIRLARSRPIAPLLRALTLIGVTTVVCNLSPALGSPARHGGFFDVPTDYLDFASQHNNVATILLERGEADRAEAEARKGLETNPRDSALWFNLACALAARGAVPEAAEAIQRSLAIGPSDPGALTLLGEIRYAQHDFLGAKETFEKAIGIDRSRARAWGKLGLALFDLGDAAGAIAALREAMRLDPAWPDPRFNLVVLLNRLGRREEALGEARRLLEADPADSKLRGLLDSMEGTPAVARPPG